MPSAERCSNWCFQPVQNRATIHVSSEESRLKGPSATPRLWSAGTIGQCLAHGSEPGLLAVVGLTPGLNSAVFGMQFSKWGAHCVAQVLPVHQRVGLLSAARQSLRAHFR